MLPHLCIKITNLGLKNSRNDLALSDVSSLDSANAPSHGISHCSTTATMVRVGHFNLYHRNDTIYRRFLSRSWEGFGRYPGPVRRLRSVRGFSRPTRLLVCGRDG